MLGVKCLPVKERERVIGGILNSQLFFKLNFQISMEVVFLSKKLDRFIA